MFLMNFAFALPSVLLFWGISYLLIIKRKKIQARNTVALAHIAGVTTILALAFSPAKSSSLVLAAFVLSVISCAILRYQEKKYQESKKQDASKGE